MLNFLHHDNIPIIVLLALFLLEQICCFFPGSFPYRLGIMIKSLTMSPVDSGVWLNLRGQVEQLFVYIHEDKIYLRRRYPTLSWGPSLFVGTIENKLSFDKISIKICPLSAFTMAVLLIEPIVFDRLILDTWYHVLWALFGYFIAICAVLYFYFDFKGRVCALLKMSDTSENM